LADIFARHIEFCETMAALFYRHTEVGSIIRIRKITGVGHGRDC